MVKMEFGQIEQNPMMAQPGNQMPVPVQQMQPDAMQQSMQMPIQQNDFNKMMQQRMKLNPQAQVKLSFIFLEKQKLKIVK